MSLLLDALKKAADDKKRSEVDAAPDTDPNNQQITSSETQSDNQSDQAAYEEESLDLELQTSADDNSVEPELDDSALYNDDEPELDTSTIDEEYSEADTETEDTIQASEVQDEANTHVFENNPASPPLELSSQPEHLTDNTSSAKPEDINQEAATKPEHITISPVDTDVTADKYYSDSSSTTKHDDYKINNEAALSALINKSNSQSISAKKKQFLTVTILTLLIFIVSGLYFYIQHESSSPEIYISQSLSTATNREPETRVIPTQSRELSKPLAQNVSVTNQHKETVSAPKPEQIKPNPVSQKPDRKQNISIVRTKKTDPVHQLLQTAYAEFNLSNYQHSRELYSLVINREPKNRDALLGLAAISIKQKHYESARQKYQLLLKLNPRDSLATAGISSINKLIDPQLNESQLKFLIKQQPNADHLFFALGSLYSTQKKWPEAQSAYFSAWSAKNRNADYAYNLAVSLDHLDKKHQALKFYQLSIELIPESNSNFSLDDTQRRINLLQRSIK